MKIIDKINETNSFYSFEYYPPKTKTGQQNLYLKMEEMLKEYSEKARSALRKIPDSDAKINLDNLIKFTSFKA